MSDKFYYLENAKRLVLSDEAHHELTRNGYDKIIELIPEEKVNQALADKDKRIEQLETRIKGMVLSLQKHGQNIDVKFHIDWLKEALSQKGGKDE